MPSHCALFLFMHILVSTAMIVLHSDPSMRTTDSSRVGGCDCRKQDRLHLLKNQDLTLVLLFVKDWIRISHFHEASTKDVFMRIKIQNKNSSQSNQSHLNWLSKVLVDRKSISRLKMRTLPLTSGSLRGARSTMCKSSAYLWVTWNLRRPSATQAEPPPRIIK